MPPTVKALVVQETATVVTAAPPTVPAPAETAQVWDGLVGCWDTVTAKAPPLATGVAKVKGTVPVPETSSSSPPLLRRRRPLPARPVTVPPTVKLSVVQVMATLVTSALVSVPEPLATEQTWLGPVGWAVTVTLKAVPLGIELVKAKLEALAAMRWPGWPAVVMVRPVPVRPETVPEMA